MNVTSHPGFQEIARQFIVRAAEDRARITVLAQSLAACEPAAMLEAHEIAHRLAGIAGTFGWVELSASARALDDLLQARCTDMPLIHEKLLVVLNDLHAVAGG